VNEQLTVGSVFSGAGLLDYGLHLAGLTHAWGCEQDEWRRALWSKRFGATCHADVRDAGSAWGRVDVVAGGFPCKGASSAGRREGFSHPETVLWREMARAVRELRPRYVLVENVRDILSNPSSQRLRPERLRLDPVPQP
jgi:DNA (cytosine-5)-methyltransferase 1